MSTPAASKEPTLNELSRRELGIPELQGVVERLASHTDREAAIVGAALLDRGLELAIRHYFVNDGSDLFTGYGPLATADAKLAIAFAMGLISSKQKSDIKSINKIRNTFGHSPENVLFDTRAVADCCRELNFTSEEAVTAAMASQGVTMTPMPEHLGLYVVDRENRIGTHVVLLGDDSSKTRFLNAVLCNWIMLFVTAHSDLGPRRMNSAAPEKAL